MQLWCWSHCTLIYFRPPKLYTIFDNASEMVYHPVLFSNTISGAATPYRWLTTQVSASFYN